MPVFRSQVESVLTQIGTDVRTILGRIGDLTSLNTSNKSNLVSAINEVRSQLGQAGASNLDGLSDVGVSAPATGHVLRHNGTEFVNVLGTSFFEPAGAVSAASANYQPVDADLTAIAALVTQAFGRGLLTLANATALTALLDVASTSVSGRTTLATSAETVTGTDAAKATTSAGTKAAIDARISSDGTLGGGSPSTTLAASQSAVKTYADQIIAAQDAFVYKGNIDASTNPNYPAANAGWTYKVSVAGRIGGASGPAVEVGDTITCLVDGTASGTQATVGANWNITQVNLDGAVIGPASSVSGNIASYNGTSGKLLQDSGYGIDNDGTMAANSSQRVPTQAAVRSYAQPLDSDLTAIAALASAANKMAYATGSGQWALTDLTAVGRTLLAAATQAAQRDAIDVWSRAEIGDLNTIDLLATYTAAKA